VRAGRAAPDRRRRMRLSVLQQFCALMLATFVIDFAVFLLVAYTEWRLAASIRPAGAAEPNLLAALATPIVFIFVDLLMGTALTVYVISILAIPLDRLLRSAVQIAEGGRPAVPGTDRQDEVGHLARALQGWEDATAARDALLERAPIGIILTDASGIVRRANRAAQSMLGGQRDDPVGRNMMEFVHPEDMTQALANRSALLAGHFERTEFEGRLISSTGALTWCSVTVAPMALPDRPVETFMVIVEDIGDRKRQLAAAARIQRELLPRTPPRIAGYQLAGACLPANEVAADLYDWVLTDDGRYLDITVADVTGKGMGSALVMATLQTALRTAPQELGPAARVAGGDEFVTFDLASAGPFVRLFQARLELATGLLGYVDAGHGYCMVLRSTGAILPLAPTFLPVGLGLGEDYHETTVTLEPGDVLVVHSDSLARHEDGASDRQALAREVDPSEDADRIVSRLIGRSAVPHVDDATFVALRRLSAAATGARMVPSRLVG
jgi:PAS domain S-box-containing protein